MFSMADFWLFLDKTVISEYNLKSVFLNLEFSGSRSFRGELFGEKG